MPRFDHGAALRVPHAHDHNGWQMLMAWLGMAGLRLGQGGSVQVDTATGPAVAMPGDWIVLSVSGEFHVALTGASRCHA